MQRLCVAIAVLGLLAFAGAAYAAGSQEDGWAGASSAGFDDELIGDYQTNWATGDESQSWTGWWDGDDAAWVPTSGTGDTGLEVTAYVELYASQTQETKAVFHWGQPPFGALNASLDGSLTSNHPCWVGIRKDGWVQADELTKASNLVFQKDFWNRSGPVATPAFPGTSTGDTTADIPLEWNMRVGSGAYDPMDWSGGVGSANWGWYSGGRLPVGSTSYRFKITATPDPYQADGKYTLDPEVIVVPDL